MPAGGSIHLHAPIDPADPAHRFQQRHSSAEAITVTHARRSVAQGITVIQVTPAGGPCPFLQCLGIAHVLRQLRRACLPDRFHQVPHRQLRRPFHRALGDNLRFRGLEQGLRILTPPWRDFPQVSTPLWNES